MNLTANAQTVAEFLLELEEMHGIKNDADSILDAISESANQLCIELSENEEAAACDYVLNQH